MKRLLALVFVGVFLSSICMGEEFCCDEPLRAETTSALSQTPGTDDATDSEFKAFLNPSGFHQTIAFHSDGHQEQQQHDHDSHHQCVGCAHAPILGFGHVSISSHYIELQNQFLDQQSFIPHPFLSGPFQPPRQS